MFRLRSLSGWLAFDAAARHGSLTRAAKELGRTQSAVSQQVKALEAELGLQLFVRRPRAVSLTPEGRTLADTLQTSLKNIEAAVTRLQQRDEPNVLRLTTNQSIAIHWLIPRLTRFTLKHPGIDVRINADDAWLDLEAEGMDLALRVGTAPKGALVIGREIFVPLYAPALLCAGSIGKDEVVRFPLLGHAHGPHLWADWLAQNGVDAGTVEVRTDYSHSGLLVQAALAGGGVALAPLHIAFEALSHGRLKLVPGEPLYTGCDYFLEATRADPPVKVQHFFDWMRTESEAMDAGIARLMA